MASEEESIVKGISFQSIDLAILKIVEKHHGLDRSSAVRFIIRDWHRLTDPDGTLLGAPLLQPAKPARKSRKVKTPVRIIV